MKLKLCTALLTAAILVPLSVVAETAPNSVEAKHAAIQTFGKLPLSFEATESPSRFLAHSGGYAVSVGAAESSVVVADSKSGKAHPLRFSFEKSNPTATIEAFDPLPGVTNYLTGNDSSKWRLGVKNYAKLRARGVYPGVDVVYYGDQHRLEFDFVVAPKADASVIALNFSGMDKLYRGSAGDIVAVISGHPLLFGKPKAYQRIGGVSKPVSAEYVLSASGHAQLKLGAYDHNSELVIDPVVSYATYLGGSSTDAVNAITVDSNLDVYVTGSTASINTSTNFPVTSGTLVGSADAFLVKYHYDQSAGVVTMKYSDIISGTLPTTNASATGTAIALDQPPLTASSNVYIAGWTNITNLPTPKNVTLTAPNAYAGGDSDAFIMIFNATTGDLVRTSYLGGKYADSAYGIAVDPSSNVIVVGQTCSPDFPAYSAWETRTENCVAFVTKLDNNLDIASPDHVTNCQVINKETVCDELPGYISPYVSGLGPAPAASGQTYYFSETFGGQPIPPLTTAGAWTPCTVYPQYAIVEDLNSTPDIQIALNDGASGEYAAPTPTSTQVPDWQAALHAITSDGAEYPCTSWTSSVPITASTPTGPINWENLGLAGQAIPGNATEANGVALDPQGDVFLVGGTNSTTLNNTWSWPAVDGPGREICITTGAGAWILKVSGVDGSCIYLHTLETTPTSNGTLDTANGVAVDGSGRAYITGTMSAALASVGGGYEQSTSGKGEAFVVRYDTDGDAQQYAASIGGSGLDEGLGIAVDSSGSAYVVGLTQSADFPMINPLQNPNSGSVSDAPITALNGGQDAFVAKLSSDGTALLFSAYLGGSEYDQANGIATDPGNLGNMYIAGSTFSSDLISDYVPESNGEFTPTLPQPSFGGGTNSDGFVAMIAGDSLPTVTVLPGSLQFGDVPVSESSQSKVVYTNNSSVSSVNITSIAVTSTSGYFALAAATTGSCETGPIAHNASCNIWVTYTPTTSSSTTFTGTLEIKDDTSSAAHVVNLSGGIASPNILLSESSMAFTNINEGTTSPEQDLTVTNNGLGPLNITGVTISTSTLTSSDFSIYSSDTSCSNSQGSTVTVASGSSCTIAVKFTPSTLGPEYGTLTIANNSSQSSLAVPLSGTVALVQSSVTPTTYGFGSQAVGTTTASSALPTFTVQNLGSTGQILYVNVGAASTNFAVVSGSNTCASSSGVAVDGTCHFQVAFSPTTTGTLAGTVTVTGNGSILPLNISLNGIATPATGLIEISSPLTQSLTFGSQTVKTTSSQTVAVYNGSSTTALANLSAAISPTGGFTITSQTCGTTLAAQGSCQYTISFTPAQVDSSAETATLTVSATGVTSATVSLSGTGATSGGGGGTADFALSAESSQVSVTQGSSATFTIYVTGTSSTSNDTVTFSCSCPSSYSISPTSLKLNGIGTAKVYLTVNTSGGSAANRHERTIPSQIFYAMLSCSFVGILLSGKRRGVRLALMLVVLGLVMGMVACGSSSSSSSGGLSPQGSPYTFSFSATSSTGATTTLPGGLTLGVSAR